MSSLRCCVRGVLWALDVNGCVQFKKQAAENASRDAAASLTALLSTSPVVAGTETVKGPAALSVSTKLTIAAAVSPPVTPAVEATPAAGAVESRSRDVVGRPKNNSASWNDAQDEALKLLVSQHNGRNWKAIATGLDGKTPTQCLHRWQRVLNPNVVKGPWKR
eukprot:COSAG02_NODE_21_length_53083_cov_95.733618_10_plen_163_part_00